MKLIRTFLTVLTVVFASGVSAHAQSARQPWSIGLSAGATMGETEIEDGSNIHLRLFGRRFLSQRFAAELGIGTGKLSGDSYETDIMPVDMRLLYKPFDPNTFTPYAYLGMGFIKYSVTKVPANAYNNAKLDTWATNRMLGAGSALSLSDRTSLDMNLGYHYTSTADINAVRKKGKDAYWSIMLGISAMLGSSGRSDEDGDGLLSDDEEQRRTNPKAKDTDGDNLNDGDEVTIYKTDPRLADTDDDGLADGMEVSEYRTNPTERDSDGDGLNDFEEATKIHSDPLKMDTDGGTIADGKEVSRGSNPLDKSDDVPAKTPEVVKPSPAPSPAKAPIVFESIFFDTKSAIVNSDAKIILNMVAATLRDNPLIKVQIQGHTDNTGVSAANSRLSEKRAESVKKELVQMGIDAARLSTKGFADTHPAAENDSAEGRRQNRRVDFIVIQ